MAMPSTGATEKLAMPVAAWRCSEASHATTILLVL